jgi:hypothetical protein
MFSLSRVLPDGSLRPISAGMTSRDEDTLACEVLPGENIAIFEGEVLRVMLGIDEDGTVHVKATDAQMAVTFHGDRRLHFLVDNPLQVFAIVRYNTFEPGDTRLFAQVFPVPQPAEPVSAV